MKEAYYFPHDSNAHDDEKILELTAEFGWEGYGMYWRLLEALRDASEYTLSKRLALLERCLSGATSELIEKFYKRCVEIGLFIESEERFYSESLMKRVSRIDENREKRAESGRKGGNARALLQQKYSIAQATEHNITEHSKEEKKKEKDLYMPPTISEIENHYLAQNLPQALAKDCAEFFWNFYENKDWEWTDGKKRRKLVKWKLAATNALTWSGIQTLKRNYLIATEEKPNGQFSQRQARR